MKIIAVITLLNFIIAQPQRNEPSEFSVDTMQVDIEMSQIEWIGRKFSGDHSGTLGLSDGWVMMNDSTLISGEFILDMTSIKNTDIESSAWRIKLENHLKSSDFFNVDSFPQASLRIHGDDSMYEKNYIVSADLTICGITHEISFPYQLEKSDSTLIAIGSVDVDRTLYNIKYKSGTYFFDLGDKIIYDEFTIKFKVHALLP